MVLPVIKKVEDGVYWVKKPELKLNMNHRAPVYLRRKGIKRVTRKYGVLFAIVDGKVYAYTDEYWKVKRAIQMLMK